MSNAIKALLTAQLDGLLAELPAKFRNSAMTTTETNHYGAGYNAVLDQFTELIQKRRNELQPKEGE